MHTCQAPYRQLYKDLLDFSRASAYQSLLAPWVKSHGEELDWLRAFGKQAAGPFTGAPSYPQATIEDRWRLYALSRVNQLLLLRFQQGNADQSDYEGPPLSAAEYRRFAEDLGLEIASAGQFSPFFHEIVTAETAASRGAPLTLAARYWPALMLGSMMFSRAGVGVTGGEDTIQPGIASSSTMYWAHRRKNRPYADLSHGWGSNSQWRTDFRRDYRIGGRFYFNVDGEHNIANAGGSEDGLTQAERIELLTHRCFIKTTKPHADLWPYGGSYSVPAG